MEQYKKGMDMGKKIPIEEKHGVVLKKEIAISYSDKKRIKILPVFMEWCLTFLISFCTIECFITGYQIEIDKRLFFCIAVLINLCLFISFSLKKGMEFCLIGEILAYGVVGYFFRGQIASGLAIVVNQVLEKIEHYYGMKFGKYQVNSEELTYDATVFMLFVSVLLIGIVVYLIRNRMSVSVLLTITLFFVFSPEYVGIVPGEWYYLIYAVCMFVYMGSRLAGKKTDTKGKIRYGAMEAKVRMFQIFSCILVLGIVSAVFSKEKYESMTRDRSFKEAVQKVLRDEFNQIVKGNLYSGSVSGGISFGELGEADNIKYTRKVKLRLTVPVDEDNLQESIYLRGYLGSVYENNTWGGLSKEASEELKSMEDKYDMAAEEYTAAAYYYLLGVKQFSESDYKPLTSAWREKLMQQPAFLEPYNGQNMKSQLELVAGGLCEDISVENVDETYGTVFTPYYAIGSLSEKNGKLSSNNIKNKGEYTWAKSSRMKKYLGLYGGTLDTAMVDVELLEDLDEMEVNPAIYSSSSYIEEANDEYFYDQEYGYVNMADDIDVENKMQRFWKKLLRETNVVEQKLGSSITEYQDATLSGTTWEGVDADAYTKVLRNALKFYTKQQEYEAFVNKTYTQISEEEKRILLDVLEDEWVEYDGDLNDLRQDILLVKEYLHNKTFYTLEPGKVPEGKDFVNYFLFENKKGYCSHYASAATLFFRSMGIPARYAEGYLAKSVKFQHATSNNGKKTVDLTDQNAHAWVEVYISGYGWLPVEVTPGYGLGEQVSTPSPTTGDGNKETAAPQTSKPVPTATSNATVSQTTASDKGFDFEKIKPVLQGILTVVAVIALILGRRACILVWRRREEQNPDFNLRAAFYYRRMETLLLPKKERKHGASLRDQIQAECLEVETVAKEDWEQLLFVMNKYAFSKAGISAEELEFIFSLYEKVMENIYKKSSGLKRLYYKYIKVV